MQCCVNMKFKSFYPIWNIIYNLKSIKDNKIASQLEF